MPLTSRRPRRPARRVRRLRHLRARARCRAARVLRALRAPAPRPGVGGHRHRPARPHHGDARPGARQPGVRRAEAARAAGRHGARPRPLLDHRRQLVGELAARLARRQARGRAGPQRQPDQRRRAARRAARAAASRSARRRTRRSSPRCCRRTRRRRSRTRWPTSMQRRRGRLLDGRDDQGPRRRVPRSGRPAAAVARHARRPLLRRVASPARSTSSARKFLRDVQPGEIVSLTEDGRADAPWRSRVAARALCVFEHIYFARPGLAARRPGAAGRARADGGDPRARGAGARPTS